MIYTTGAAGAALHLSTHTVRVYCIRYGVGKRHGRDWLLQESDLDTIRKRMRGKGENHGTAP